MSTFTEMMNNYIMFHERELTQFPFPLFTTNEEDSINMNMKFGILNLQTEKTEYVKKPITILFSLDNSASMSDQCSDGRTKMHHATHTLTNILRIFSETENVECHIGIIAFNTEVMKIIDFTEMKPGKIFDEAIQQIEKIYATSCTNIEASLDYAKNTLEEYKNKNPNHKIVHIQLTDGDATDGNTTPEYLQKLVSPNYSNIFVGFGSDHNSYLLQKLSSNKNGEYLFVDKIENAGLVYGEIIHSLLYPAFEEGYIEMVHAEIYDWNKNTWSNRFDIPSIASEVKKTFHIRTNDMNNFECKLYGITVESNHNNIVELLDEIYTLPSLIPIPEHNSTEHIELEDFIDINDFTEYLYRQKVQELLYKINKINDDIYNKNPKRKISPAASADPFRTPPTTPPKIEIEDDHIKLSIRKYAKSIFQSMKQYKNDLENMVFPDENKIKFVKVLMDDVYVAYKTIGTKKSHMYSCARQRSQGRQYTYNVTSIEDCDDNDDIKILSNPPILQRKIKSRTLLNNPYDHEVVFPNDENDDEKPSLNLLDLNIDDYSEVDDDIEADHFELSQNTETSYATPKILHLMRSVSEK